MSQTQYIQTLQRQLSRLNEQIDRKIMMGRNYAADARQHKLVLTRIRKHTHRRFIDKLAYSISSLFNYA